MESLLRERDLTFGCCRIYHVVFEAPDMPLNSVCTMPRPRRARESRTGFERDAVAGCGQRVLSSRVSRRPRAEVGDWR